MLSKRRPNIVVITTHDSGRHFGCYGVESVHTPHIDALAAGGVLFTGMHAVTSICSPSRGALLTGQYPQTNGLVGLAGAPWNWELHDYRPHLSHRMRALGYETALFGMQHDTAFVDRLGFDDFSGHGVHAKDRDISAVEVADRFAHYVRRRPDGKPFYAQIGFFETHTPFSFAGCEPDQSKGVWIPPYTEKRAWPAWHADYCKRTGRERSPLPAYMAALQGSVRMVDAAVGRITDALQSHGLMENTLLLFNTDHGPELPGAKWTLYDPGTAIAFILHWPGGGVPAGAIQDSLLSNVDFLPTLYALLEQEAPPDLEGIPFASACGGPDAGGRASRDAIFCHYVDALQFSARTETHKLISNATGQAANGSSARYELFDLAKDPLERQNVAHDQAYQVVLQSLRGRLQAHLDTVGDPITTMALEGVEPERMGRMYRERYEQQRRHQRAGHYGTHEGEACR